MIGRNGRSWISRWVAAPTCKVKTPSYCLANFFPENCMKMKEIVLGASLRSSNFLDVLLEIIIVLGNRSCCLAQCDFVDTIFAVREDGWTSELSLDIFRFKYLISSFLKRLDSASPQPPFRTGIRNIEKIFIPYGSVLYFWSLGSNTQGWCEVFDRINFWLWLHNIDQMQVSINTEYLYLCGEIVKLNQYCKRHLITTINNHSHFRTKTNGCHIVSEQKSRSRSSYWVKVSSVSSQFKKFGEINIVRPFSSCH